MLSRIGVSRRAFGLSAVASSFTGLAQEKVPAGKSAEPAPQSDGSDLGPEGQAEVEARFGEISRKYGDRLSEDQRTRLRRVLTQNVRMLSAIRRFSVANGDAPATTLKLQVETAAATDSCPSNHGS